MSNENKYYWSLKKDWDEGTEIEGPFETIEDCIKDAKLYDYECPIKRIYVAKADIPESEFIKETIKDYFDYDNLLEYLQDHLEEADIQFMGLGEYCSEMITNELDEVIKEKKEKLTQQLTNVFMKYCKINDIGKDYVCSEEFEVEINNK